MIHYQMLDKKSVLDTDDFYTDLSIWEYLDDDRPIVGYLIMFGDVDIYDPDVDYAEECFTSLDAAYEAFNNWEELMSWSSYDTELVSYIYE